MALVLACALPVAALPPRVLRAVTTRPAPDGATVVLALNRPSTPRVALVRDDAGGLRRIYVDLPAGTTVGRGVTRPLAGHGPIARVRVGLAGDRPRVVIEVDGATEYRLERNPAPSTIALTIVGGGGGGADAPAPSRTARGIVRERPKIVLDPGHGGDDPGAEGYAVEKEVTLDIARRLADLLRERLDAEVVLTRDDDATLALKERTARANAEGADLFVSIHANASETGRLRGVETYYLDNSTDRGTLRLAGMENGLDLLRPKADEAALRYILSDLVQVGKLDESARLARQLQRALVARLRGRYSNVVDLGVKRGPFYVLVGAYMPCVLVETAFLSHPIEGRRLARADYRADVAQGLYAGIARFLADGSRRRTL